MQRDNSELDPLTIEDNAISDGSARPDRRDVQGPPTRDGTPGGHDTTPRPDYRDQTSPIGAPMDEEEFGSARGGTRPDDTTNPSYPDRRSTLGTPGGVESNSDDDVEPGTRDVPGTPVPDAFGVDPTPPAINGKRSGQEGARQTLRGTNAGVATGRTAGNLGELGRPDVDGIGGTMDPAIPEENNASQSSLGANEDQVDRDDVTSDVTDMGLDALGRDEPDDPDYGRGEPSPEEGFARPDDDTPGWTRRDTDVPGYGRTGTPGLGGARPPQPERDDESFESRGHDMKAPPDAGLMDGAGGSGYDSAGSNTSEQSAAFGGGAANGMAGSGPIGGVPARADTPDAAARRQIERTPGPSASPQPSIGVSSPTDNTVPNPSPPAVSTNRSAEAAPDAGERGVVSSYDGEDESAGSGGTTSGGGGLMASRAARDNRGSAQTGDDDDRNIYYGSSGGMGLGGAEPPSPEPRYAPADRQKDPDLEGRDPVDEELFRPAGSHGPGTDTPLGPPPGSGVSGDSSGPDVFASDSGPIDAPADSGIVTAGDLRREWEDGTPLPEQSGPSPVPDDTAFHGDSGGLGGGAWTGGVQGQSSMFSGGSGRSGGSGGEADEALRRAAEWSRNDVSAGPEPVYRDDLGSASTAANDSSLNSDLEDPSSPPLGPGNPNIPGQAAPNEDPFDPSRDPTRSADLAPEGGDLVLEPGTHVDVDAADPTKPSDDVTGPGANI